MKVKITEEQLTNVKSKMGYENILDEMVFKISILTEDDGKEPDMEWDFSDVKKDLDSSSKWVKTKEDALEYLAELKNKIQNLPSNIKKRILRYVLYSFLGIFTLNQINSYLETPLEKAVEVEKKAFKTFKEVEAPKKIRKSSEDLKTHLRYEEGSIRDKGQPVLTAYNLGDGAYTIGYGHAIFPGEDEGYDFLPKYNKIRSGETSITKGQAELLLDDDVRIAEGIVNKILDDWDEQGIKPKITQGMYDAMVSMAYNMGNGIRRSEFIQAVKRGDIVNAKELILQTSDHLFDNFPGLKKRREKEYNMFV
jgi:GH24 family phage-related lysozyme (muramidase)